jgi:hypothetical protein
MNHFSAAMWFDDKKLKWSNVSTDAASVVKQ